MPKSIKFSKEELNLINQLFYDEKLSLKEIGNKLNCSETAIRTFVKKNKMVRSSEVKINEDKIIDLFFKNYTNKEIANSCNLTINQIKNVLKNNNLYRNNYEHLSITLSDNEKHKITKLYESNNSIKSIASLLNRDESTISKFLHDNDIFKVRKINNLYAPSEIISENNINITEEFVLKFYEYFVEHAQYARFPLHNICNYFSISLEMAKFIVDEFEIEYTYDRKYIEESFVTNINATYIANYNYFDEIDTSNKAYWLGFIASDGSIYERKNILKLEIHPKDTDILEKFNIDLNSTYPLRYREMKPIVGGKYNEYFLIRVAITSKHMIEQLSNKGLVQNKTKILNWKNITDNIPSEYIADFIRGYFDGDGCWSINKNNRISFNIGGASKDIIEKMFIHLKNKLELNKKVNIYEKNNFYSFTFASYNDILKLYHYLYNGGIRGNRKYNIIKYYIEEKEKGC